MSPLPCGVSKSATSSPKPSKGRRWLTRIALFVVGALIIGAGFFAYRIHAAGQVPSYYSRQRLEGEDRLEAIASVERKFGNFQGSLGAALAGQTRRRNAGDSATSQPTEAESAELTFSGDELDAYFNKWLTDNNYTDSFAKQLSDPRLLLDNGRLILAGRREVPWMGDTVVSMHFSPSVSEETGKASMSLEGIYAGNTSLPEMAVEEMRTRAAAAIEARLPGYVESAAFEADGTANDAAVGLAIDRQLARLLEQRPVEDLVLFPYLVGRGHVAVRVESLTIQDGVLDLDVLPLTPREREAYLEAIKAGSDEDVDVDALTDAAE